MTIQTVLRSLAKLKNTVGVIYEKVFGKHALGSLDVSGTLPSNNDTQVIAGDTYTYKITPTLATHIQIATTQAAQAINIAAAVAANNGDVQTAILNDTTLQIKAIERGTDGNEIAIGNSTGDKIVASGDTLEGGEDGVTADFSALTAGKVDVNPADEAVAVGLNDEFYISQADIVVAGAGQTVVNGTYIYEGQADGYNTYHKVGDATYKIAGDPAGWRLYVDTGFLVILFYTGTATPNAWDAVWSLDAGTAPAPTTTESVAVKTVTRGNGKVGYLGVPSVSWDADITTTINHVDHCFDALRGQTGTFTLAIDDSLDYQGGECWSFTNLSNSTTMVTLANTPANLYLLDGTITSHGAIAVAPGGSGVVRLSADATTFNVSGNSGLSID